MTSTVPFALRAGAALALLGAIVAAPAAAPQGPGHGDASAATLPVVTISPTSVVPKDSYIARFTTVNAYTKHYYVMRAYLEKFEKAGGGTLILNRGNYSITNTLYVPSNVTIRLRDGVYIRKGTKTGTTKLTPAESIFQLRRPSKGILPKNTSGYLGDRNIKILGEGSATIDLDYYKAGKAIVAGHNQNVTISGITFRDLSTGHFIEMDANYNALIEKNRFLGSVASSGFNAEAINLDVPDAVLKGFNVIWSTQDRTPNKAVTIRGNTFYNLDRAIGSHQYSQGIYHSGIKVLGNSISVTRSDAIRVMNWKDSEISGNRISKVANYTAGPPATQLRGILASGAINPTFTANTFSQVQRPMQFLAAKNQTNGTWYAPTYNVMSDDNLYDLSFNIAAEQVLEPFIRVNPSKTPGDYTGTEMYYLLTP